jgi:hypothetical protein
MTDKIKGEIERLLEEPDDLPAAGQPSSLLRARLAATMAEGLADAAAAADGEAIDAATMAAFIDGRLSAAELEEFTAAMAQQPSLRADMESVTALVDEIAEAPLKAPADLLARANARLVPAAAPARPAQSQSRWQLSALLPRRPVAWAMVAALLVLLLAPAVVFVGNHFGPIQTHVGEPDLTFAPDAGDDDDQQACPDKSKDGASKEASKDDSKDASKIDTSKDDKSKDQAQLEKAKSDAQAQQGAGAADKPAKPNPCDKPDGNDTSKPNK